MKNRWIALLLAAAVVCLPAWLALKLTGADAPAETAGQPVLVTAMARAGAMEETALSAAEPLAAALEQLRVRVMGKKVREKVLYFFSVGEEKML